MTTSESKLLALAHRRHMVVNRSLLVANGVNDVDIARFRRRGLLRSTPAHGVYGVGRVPTSRAEQRSAALLAAGGSALYRKSAAPALGLPLSGIYEREPLEIVVPEGGPTRSPWARVHRTRHLREVDVVELGGMRITSPARTFCDLATCSTFERLSTLGQKLLINTKIDPGDLFGCAASFIRRGRPGSRLLRRVLAKLDDGEPIPDSILELALIERVLIPFAVPLDRQFRPPWYDGWRGITDFGSAESRVITEVDGRNWHQIAQDVARDRQRDRLALRHGYVTLRFTADEIRRDPTAIADELWFHIAERTESRTA